MPPENPPQDSEESQDEGGAREPDPLGHLLEQFEARIEGLVELLDALSPHVAALDRPEGVERVIDEAGMSEPGKALAKAVFVPNLDAGDSDESSGSDSQAEQANSDNSSAALAEEGVELPVITNGGTGAEPDTELVSGEQAGQVLEKALNTLLKREPAAIMKIFRRLARGGLAPREELLNGSLLTVAVAAFESLLAGLFREHLLRHPNQLDGQEKEFSLGDLLELGTVEEAQRVLIERRTDSFMRKGFDDWSRWSEKTLGLGFDALSLDSRNIREVFQRRHLIVHTGGLVTQLYLDRVEFPEGSPPPEVGSEIHVDVDYLRLALDEVLVLGLAITSVAMSKWISEEGPDRAGGRLNSSLYDLMKEDRWPLVKTLCDVGCGLGQSESNRWIITVNGWLAARALSEDDACATDIAAWDVSALEPKFKLAKAALQGHADQVMEFLPKTLESMGEEAIMVPGWPLLDPYRNDERFVRIVAEAGVTVPGSPSPDASSGGAEEAEVGKVDDTAQEDE